MTDYLLMFVLLIAVFFAIDPFLLYADKRTLFKHVHLILAFLVIGVAWVGSRINRTEIKDGRVINQCWPLVIFAAWVVGGALYARFHEKIVETFLIMGLYMFITPLFARFIADHRAPGPLLNRYLALLLSAILVGAVWQAVQLGRWSEFHEEEYLTVPLAVYFFVRSKGFTGRFFSLILLTALMLTVIKNTSFIVTTIVLAYLWWVFVREEVMARPALQRLPHFLMLAFLAGSVVAVFAGIKAYSDSALPDGNPKYRMHTYEQTLASFKESPVVGKSFTGAGAEKFGLFTVAASTQVLPTHSDVLDILAQGGVIGLGFFIFALWCIARYIHNRFRGRAASSLSPGLVAHFHWLAVSCLSVVPVIAFNPIMLQPGKAFILWMNLGILLGLAKRCERSSNTTATV